MSYYKSPFIVRIRIPILSLLILFTSIGLNSNLTQAQTNLTGKVIDASSKSALKGVTIATSDPAISTISGTKGRFSLQIPSEIDSLHFSHIGYEPKSILITDTTRNLTIYLQPTLREFNEVVVTASKVQVARNNVPLTVSVINASELRQSSETNILPILSEQVPGLFVTERGVTGFGVAQGSAGNISIRGMGGSPTTRVLVLIDGNPQFMGLMGHPLPDNYATSDAHKVEVIRGPASVLYGSNALGGVINIITRAPQTNGFDFNARTSYGSYDTGKIMANTGYRQDKLNLFASINRNSTDGHRDSSDFEITNGYFKADYQLSSHFDIGGDFRLAHFEASDPGPIGGSPGERIDILRGKASVSLDHRHNNMEGSLNAYYNFGTHDITDGWHSDDYLYGLMLHESFDLSQTNTLTVGYDYMKYGGKGSPIITVVRDEQGNPVIGPTGPRFRPADINNEWISSSQQALYSYVQQRFRDAITVTGGLRYQVHPDFDNAWIPQAGVAWQVGAHTTLKGSVSKGYRPPSLRELYFFPPANEDLQPENTLNYEISWMQQWPEIKMQSEITVFRSEGDNLITQQAPPFPPQYRNTGDFANTGIEAVLDYKITSDVSLHANYAYIHMETPLIATPEHDLFISGRYRSDAYGFRLKAHSVWNLYGEGMGVENVPIENHYLTIGARTHYQVSPAIEIFLQAENLLDESYQTKAGYPMPGITVTGGISFQP